LLDWAGITAPVEVGGSPLEVRLLPSGEELLLFAFNHDRQPATSTVRLDARGRRWTVSDLETDKAIAPAREDGRIRLDLRLPGQEVTVLRLTPR